MNKTSYQLIKFLIVGVSIVTFNVLFLYVLVGFLHVWYLLASVISYALSVVLNFILQKFLVFNDSLPKDVKRQFVLYALVSAVYLILNILFMYVFVDQFGINYLIAQTIITLSLSVINFFINRNFIFAEE